MRRPYFLVLAALFAVSLFIPHNTKAQSGPLCFPGVAGIVDCIDGRFREFWEQNGQLAVFGYPISPARIQTTAEGSFLTQLFERNRFELHPEKARPYDVLLGRLGAERLAQLGRDWQAEPRESGAQAGCLWFEQTGHNVCTQSGTIGFKTYWETNGLRDPALNAFGQSLALLGLPLTSLRTETNAAGATVLTQWFERGRFEYHPGNPDQFKVLLGLLGREVTTTTPPPAPMQPPVPPPAPPQPPEPAPNVCADVPPPVSARVRPSNCVKEGEIIFFDIYGFQPNEQIGYWLTTPWGDIFGTRQTLGIGPSGGVSGLDFDTIDLDPGLWYFVFEGVNSKHQSIVYFKVLPR